MKAVISAFIIILLHHNTLCAQQVSYTDSSFALNNMRVKTNQTGMKVLGSWGIANVAVGAIGYFTAKDKEWQYFHGMNAVWGIINTGIAGAGLAGARKELDERLNYSSYLQKYEGTRRLYLINAGLDVLYIGTGIYLTEHSRNVTNNPQLWRGFGRSIAMQGIFLFVFDNVMYAMHSRQSKKWYHLLQGMCIGGNSVGFNYSF